MKKFNITKEQGKKLSAAGLIKLARILRKESRKTLNLPENFDVIKYVHRMR